MCALVTHSRGPRPAAARGVCPEQVPGLGEQRHGAQVGREAATPPRTFS